MGETENRNKIPFFVIGMCIMSLLLFLIVWGLNRGKPWVIIFMYYIITMMIFGILGTIIYLIVWFVMPQRKDMVWIAKQRMIAACKSCRPLFKQTLMFRGENELETRFIGFVVGICKLKSEEVKIIKHDNYNKTDSLEKGKDSSEMYLIAFRKALGLLGMLFSPVEIVLGTKEDFSNLNMDVVYIKDICFSPKLYDLLIPSKHYKDTHILDEPVKNLIYRYTLQENLVEMREIAQDYLAISPTYQKARNMSKAQEFGLMNRNQGNNQQG